MGIYLTFTTPVGCKPFQQSRLTLVCFAIQCSRARTGQLTRSPLLSTRRAYGYPLTSSVRKISMLKTRAGAGSRRSTHRRQDCPFRDRGATMTQAAAAVTRIPFVSECPRCGDERAQWYSDRAVSTPLRRGHPVEGYCVMCQEYWQLDSHERSDLAAKLAG